MPSAATISAPNDTLGVVIVCLEFARAARMRSLAEQLAALGHRVTFLTSEPHSSDPRYRVVALPFASAGSLLKRAAGLESGANLALEARKRGALAEKVVRVAAKLFDSVSQHPDKYHRWIPVCRSYLASQPTELDDCDVVIASAPPATALLVGRAVADHVGGPLVLDFRDLWTDNPSYSFGRIRRAIDRRRESSLVNSADAITAATEYFRASLAKRFSPPARAVYTGIDPSPWVPKSPRCPDGFLRFGHFGVWYAGRRSIRPLTLAIRRLADAGKIDAERIRIEMFGHVDASVLRDAEEAGLAENLVQHGWIEPFQVPEALSGVDVALLLAWPEDVWSVPLKTYHYLAGRKRVLVLGASRQSELARMVDGLAGVVVAEAPDELDAAIHSCWADWENGNTLDIAPGVRALPTTPQGMALGFLASIREDVGL
jgi:glycosyltransferase involved in cell wall biosynthesis